MDYTSVIAEQLAQQQAQNEQIGFRIPDIGSNPSLGAMQQAQRQYQPYGNNNYVGGAPPQQAGGPRAASQYMSTTPTNPVQTLKGQLTLDRMGNRSGNVSLDALASRKLEERALGIEEKYAEEQKDLAIEKAQAEKKLAAEAAQKLGDDAYFAVMELTGDKKMASEVAHIMTSDPATARSIITQMAEKKYDTSKAAVTNVNLPPPAGYQWTDESKTKLEAIPGGKPWNEAKAEENKATQLSIDQNQTSQIITNQIGKIKEEIDNSVLPATGTGGAAVRAITQMISPKTGEGEVPLFESATAAGEVTRRNEVIKNNIALATINNMRSFSPNGGALGNVSNFEVRMVQNVKDALDPTRGKESYLDALDTVEMVQKRAAYLARHGDDMMKKAEESGKRPEVFIMDILNKQFPIDEKFTQGIIDEETGWDGLGVNATDDGQAGDSGVLRYDPATGKWQ